MDPFFQPINETVYDCEDFDVDDFEEVDLDDEDAEEDEDEDEDELVDDVLDRLTTGEGCSGSAVSWAGVPSGGDTCWLISLPSLSNSEGAAASKVTFS